MKKRVQGWSQSGKLLTQKKSPTVSLQANFENTLSISESDQPANTYTVQFGITPPGPDPTSAAFTGVFEALAFITWSVEGNSIQRIINIANGISISGVGQACHVVVQDNTPNIGNNNTPGLEYDVTINISPGLRAAPTSDIPTLLGTMSPADMLNPSPIPGTFVIGVGGSEVVPVPENAGVVSVEVVCADFTGITPKFTVQQSIGNSVVKVYEGDYDIGFVTLAPGCNSIKVFNKDAVQIDCTVTFGIDG